MRTKRLSKKEIDGINLFISNVIDIDIVEGIYIVPYRDVANNKQGARIITIFNESLDYSRKLTGSEERFNAFERDSLDWTILNYNGFFGTDLTFYSNNASNYNLELFHHREKMSLKSLVSGTILFDRFGDVSKTKEQASTLIEPFEETIKIRNMKAILPTEVSSQYVKKSDN